MKIACRVNNAQLYLLSQLPCSAYVSAFRMLCKALFFFSLYFSYFPTLFSIVVSVLLTGCYTARQGPQHWKATGSFSHSFRFQL